MLREDRREHKEKAFSAHFPAEKMAGLRLALAALSRRQDKARQGALSAVEEEPRICSFSDLWINRTAHLAKLHTLHYNSF